MLKPHELDTSSSADLMQFWLATSTHPIQTGRAIFPDRPYRYVTATLDLGHYASNKATAQACRLRGDIPAAMLYEDICQIIYKRLPDYARW